MIERTIDNFRHRRSASARVSVRVEKLAPHRCQENKMIREAEILLRDLKLGHHLRARHRSEQRMKRLAWLEVNWTILHLQQHVRRELTVERLQVLVSSASAVVAGLLVVNKRAPHDDAVMRRDRSREHVRAIGMRAMVRSWTRLALAVRLHEKAAEVRNHFVDLVGLPLPPRNDGRIERIGSRQVVQLDRRREARRQVNANAKRTKDIGNRRDLSEILRR